MVRYSLLGLLPVVFACTNPDTDPCASYISAQKATASPFCATFTKSTVTATTALPAWATYCSSKPSLISKECSCYWTGATAATSTTKVGTTLTTTTSGAGSTATGGTGNTCGAAPVDGLVGYAAGVTGGGSGSGTTVTSCSALSTAVKSGGVIKVSGILTGCGVIDLVGGTTVIGVGSNSGKLLSWRLPTMR
jgi:pectate lyase